MICRSCLRAIARPLRSDVNSALPRNQRLITTTNGPLKALSVSNASSPHKTTTPSSIATYATSAAPNSPATPETTDAKPKHGAAAAAAAKGATLVLSSVPAGTPLKGLNFLKGRTDPIAMEDSEYPPWLWEILKKQEQAAEKGKEGDLFSKSKKQRRLAAKRLRKEQAAHPEMMARKVPVYEQTVDLPAGDGTLEGAMRADEAREALQKAMRIKRRATIKEANFLKAMG